MGTVVTDFGENPSPSGRPDVRKAGQYRGVGMLCDGVLGRLGEMIGRAAGGIELRDQCLGLFTVGGFRAMVDAVARDRPSRMLRSSLLTDPVIGLTFWCS